MSIAEKLTQIADNQQKVFNAGKKAEYDRFWDVYQKNGKRRFYGYAFAGDGWNADTFYPKYDIVVSGYTPAGMFMYFGYTTGSDPFDLEARLQELGVTLDLSANTSSVANMFNQANISVVPELDFSKLKSIDLLCQNSKIVTFRKIKVSEDATYKNSFGGCAQLENITFEGTIGANISFADSPKLTKASIENIVNTLSDTKESLTLTLSSAAVAQAFETQTGAGDGAASAQWLALKATKPNWNIVLN